MCLSSLASPFSVRMETAGRSNGACWNYSLTACRSEYIKTFHSVCMCVRYWCRDSDMIRSIRLSLPCSGHDSIQSQRQCLKIYWPKKLLATWLDVFCHPFHLRQTCCLLMLTFSMFIPSANALCNPIMLLWDVPLSSLYASTRLLTLHTTRCSTIARFYRSDIQVLCFCLFSINPRNKMDCITGSCIKYSSAFVFLARNCLFLGWDGTRKCLGSSAKRVLAPHVPVCTFLSVHDTCLVCFGSKSWVCSPSSADCNEATWRMLSA